MVLLPYNSDQNSTPIKKQVIHNEIRSFKDSTIVRSFGYTRTFFKDESGMIFEKIQTQVINCLIPSKKFIRGETFEGKKLKRLKGKKKGSESSQDIKEPMEQPQAKGHNKRHLNSNHKKEISKLKNNSNWVYKTGFYALILPIAICIFYPSFRKYNYEWNFEEVSSKLSSNVFGQKEVIYKVNSTLGLVNETNGLHVVMFTGSVGVGKTLTSTILSESLPWASNKLIVQFSNGTSTAKKLSVTFSDFGCNFVRIDDLSQNDVDQVIDLVKGLKNHMKNEKVLLLLIFTTYNKEEEKKVLLSFKNSHLPVIFIPFKNLTQEAVKECYEFEMRKQEAQISALELDKLIQNKMKIINVSKGSVGCKGVAQDVSYYLKKKK